MKIFFEIRKQKYLEALDRQDKAKAKILGTDLEVFSTFNEELYKEVTQFFSLRENERLPKYGDTKTARIIMLIALKKLIEANPLFLNKLTFPSMKSSRLWALIKHGLKWELRFGKNPRPNPDVKKLFIDHLYTTPFGPLAPTPLILPVAAVAKPANESTQ
ncbi:topless-related protein 3-like [Pistacia vera]|uniref:topless-related protein 3-like n=1 Tax=Pistacia vera TaxID=55513 RepID=UPI0012632F81|nr:topless-related protein 3-like [Pistacia vera]